MTVMRIAAVIAGVALAAASVWLAVHGNHRDLVTIPGSLAMLFVGSLLLRYGFTGRSQFRSSSRVQ